jgi:hypothetical protein
MFNQGLFAPGVFLPGLFHRTIVLGGPVPPRPSAFAHARPPADPVVPLPQAYATVR